MNESGSELKNVTDRIEQIIAYIRENISTIESVEEIARTWGYSKYHFSREFKRLTGFSAQQFISSLKMEASIERLVTSKTSVLASHLHAGYLSSSTFTASFEKQTGITPKQYQKQLSNLYKILQSYEEVPHNHVKTHHEALFSSSYKHRCTVTLEYPSEYKRGITFIGLFHSPIPNHKPIIGQAIIGSSLCKFENIPEGSYYLLACAIEKNSPFYKYFILKDCLRGRIERKIDFPADHKSHFHIVLRPAIPQDPPILVNLPKILADAIKNRKDSNL